METIVLKLNDYSNSIKNELKVIREKIDKNLKITAIDSTGDQSYLSYLQGLKKSGEYLGINLEILNISENDEINFKKSLISVLKKLNDDKNNYGIIVGNPLPFGISLDILACNIDYKKDIDGITYLNSGKLFSGNPFMIPATAWAVDLTLKYIEKNYSYNLSGKNAIVIGRSNIVGKPVSLLLLKRNATVTIIHTKTIKPEKISQDKDIIIACCGVRGLINQNWVKEGAIVIDVGIHCYQDDNKIKICGDVDTQSLINKAYIVTPVPNGIGSLTNTLLFANCIKSYFISEEKLEYNFEFEK